MPAPSLTAGEWREFRDLLLPYGVFPLLAHRLQKWLVECRPSGEVTARLDRVYPYAVAQTVQAFLPTALYCRGSSFH